MSIKKIIIIIVVLAVAYFAYGKFIAGNQNQAPQGMAAPVSVAEIVEKEVQQWNEFSGRLVAVDQVEIRPRVSGIIDSVNFKNGSIVKKGDLLFVIDPRPYQAALQSAEARSVLAEGDFKRADSLFADKAIPKREYDLRKNNIEVARADLIKAQLDLEYTQIKAPISGRVGRAEITTGNLVEATGNAPILTSIVSSNPIYADFEVDEDTFLQYIRTDANGDIKAPVMMGLTSETDTPRQGSVESFDNKLNTASGTVRVRAVFENPTGILVPGLFAKIKLGNSEGFKSLLISDKAVGTDQSKKLVLVVGDDNKVYYREVKLGGIAEGLRVVKDGLKAGEKIIIEGLQRARPGQEVKPEIVQMSGNSLIPAQNIVPSSAEIVTAPDQAEQKNEDTIKIQPTEATIEVETPSPAVEVNETPQE